MSFKQVFFTATLIAVIAGVSLHYFDATVEETALNAIRCPDAKCGCILWECGNHAPSHRVFGCEYIHDRKYDTCRRWRVAGCTHARGYHCACRDNNKENQ